MTVLFPGHHHDDAGENPRHGDWRVPIIQAIGGVIVAGSVTAAFMIASNMAVHRELDNSLADHGWEVGHAFSISAAPPAPGG